MIIIGYVMPLSGLELLGMARDVATFNLSARVGHPSGSACNALVAVTRGGHFVDRRLLQSARLVSIGPDQAERERRRDDPPTRRRSFRSVAAGGRGSVCRNCIGATNSPPPPLDRNDRLLLSRI